MPDLTDAVPTLGAKEARLGGFTTVQLADQGAEANNVVVIYADGTSTPAISSPALALVEGEDNPYLSHEAEVAGGVFGGPHLAPVDHVPTGEFATDYSAIVVKGSAGEAIGAGDFTLEAWFRQRDTSAPPEDGPFLTGGQTWRVSGISGGEAFLIFAATQVWDYDPEVVTIDPPLLTLGVTGGGDTAFFPIGETEVSLNQWYHLAMVRENGTVSAWFNGVRSPQTGTSTIELTSDTELILGLNQDFYQARLTIGQALYSGPSIVLPSQPWVLP